MLGVRPARVVVSGGAGDPAYRADDVTVPPTLSARRALAHLGIKGPFAFSVASFEHSKNLRGLIDAFGMLPPRLTFTHQLVIACRLTEDERAQARAYAEERGIGERLVLAGEVPGPTLALLHQRSSAFVSPSYHEGFSMPLLEALQCGAPVVAGHNSAQAELVGQAGLLVNVHDPADMAAHLGKVLADPDLAHELRCRALERSRTFSWERAARTTIQALVGTVRAVRKSSISHPLESLRKRRLRLDLPQGARPRLAIFSPWPPKGSGISDYATRLVNELLPHYTIDLFHDSGYMPEPALASLELGCHDYRLFERLAAAVPYHRILYQMGNSLYHRFMYPTMMRHPGVVTLHDFCLSGFQHWYSLNAADRPDYLEEELRHCHPERAEELISAIDTLNLEPGGLQEALARRGIYVNRRVFERALQVVVHSPWCVRQVAALFPEQLERTCVIPHGANSRNVSAQEKAAIRARFNLPADALIFASFGNLHLTKMNVEALTAFEPLALADPRALFLFVGHDWGLGQARWHARELGIENRVRFLGRRPAADFADLIAVADIGVSLRLPPTNGETSGSLLDLLRTGVPAVVTDVAAFSDYPDSVVRKVNWEHAGLDGLRRVLAELAADPRQRAELGDRARRHVADHHAWPRAGELYRQVIEECQPASERASRVRAATLRSPYARPAVRQSVA